MSHSQRIIATKSYKEAILSTDEVDSPTVGFAKASEGTASSLATIIRQNNTIIALLTTIAEKLSDQQTPVPESSSSALEEALEEITDQLKDLKLRSIGKEVVAPTKGRLYVFRDPLQIPKEDEGTRDVFQSHVSNND